MFTNVERCQVEAKGRGAVLNRSHECLGRPPALTLLEGGGDRLEVGGVAGGTVRVRLDRSVIEPGAFGPEKAVDKGEFLAVRFAGEALQRAVLLEELRQIVAKRRRQRDPLLPLGQALYQQVDVGEMGASRATSVCSR